MTKGALALLIHGGTDNWSPDRWKARFDDVCRDRPVWLMPAAGFDPADIHYAAVWKPVPGELAGFPNLKVIFNLGAGVDALIADKSLPDVPLVRVAVPDLTSRMTEYVVLHVLMHHRQELYLRQSQIAKRWAPKFQWPARAISVGIMGLGTLGANAADVLRRIGFRVAGWSRSARQVDHVECYSGAGQLESFLRRTDILVCLLPLTRQTAGILDHGLFSKLNRTSPQRLQVSKLLHHPPRLRVSCRDEGQEPPRLPIRDDLNDRWAGQALRWVQHPVPTGLRRCLVRPRQHRRQGKHSDRFLAIP